MLADLDVLVQQPAVFGAVGEPAAVPGAVDAEAQPDRIDFLTHQAASPTSRTTMVISANGFSMRDDAAASRGRRSASSPGSCPRRPRRRPGCRCRGCGCSRRSRSPNSSALRRPRRCACGENSSSFSARCTFRPRIDCGDQVQLLRAGAQRAHLGHRFVGRHAASDLGFLRHGLLPLRLLVGGVAGEVAGRRELAELLADHVFSDTRPGRASGRCGRRRSGRRTAA